MPVTEQILDGLRATTRDVGSASKGFSTMGTSGRTVAIVHEERYFWHQSYLDQGPGIQDPARFQMENPEPRRRLRDLLDASGLLDQMVRIRAREVTRDDLIRVHDEEYVDAVAARNETGGDAGEITPFSAGGYDIARLSAGGAYAAIDAVYRREVGTAFALVRPPGHHAERDRGRGFCLFANIAVAIERLRAEQGPVRVAVLDWDVHHGNGTQWLYYGDPDTLTISIHQDRLYPPDSGMVEETGGHHALGSNVNIPLPPGSGRGAYVHAFEEVVQPALRTFHPDLIVVACGFDASALDPSSNMLLSASAFADLTARIRAVAEDCADGRLAMVQEGGYSSVYVPVCGQAVISELLDEDPPSIRFASYVDRDPYQELQPHQADVVRIARAAAVASGAIRPKQ